MTAMLLLAAMTPFIYTGVIAPYADVIAMVYIFTMFRFAMVLGGLEGGSAFGGMGSSREASTIPTLMAITISNSTVSDMQISITMMSSFGA